MIALLAIYVLVAGKLLNTWLTGFKQATDLSDEQKFLCVIVLAIATVFWPIVLPISYLEKCSKTERKFKKNHQIQDNLAL